MSSVLLAQILLFLPKLPSLLQKQLMLQDVEPLSDVGNPVFVMLFF